MLFRLARIGYPQEFGLAAFAGGLWPWAGYGRFSAGISGWDLIAGHPLFDSRASPPPQDYF